MGPCQQSCTLEHVGMGHVNIVAKIVAVGAATFPEE